MNYVKRLFIVDAKTKKMQDIFPEKVIYESLVKSLKEFLKDSLAVHVAEELVAKCVFPDLSKTIIIIEEDGTLKKIDLPSYHVTDILVDNLVPTYSEEENEIIDKAINELKAKIIDFSTVEVINPVVLILDYEICGYYSDKVNDISFLTEFFSKNYLSEKRAKSLAKEVSNTLLSYVVKIISFKDYTKKYIYKNGKMELLKEDTNKVKAVLMDYFKYIPNLADEATAELLNALIFGVLDKRIFTLNIKKVDEKYFYAEEELFGTTIMIKCNKEKEKDSIFIGILKGTPLYSTDDFMHNTYGTLKKYIYDADSAEVKGYYPFAGYGKVYMELISNYNYNEGTSDPEIFIYVDKKAE